MNRILILLWIAVLLIAISALAISDLWLIFGKLDLATVKTQHFLTGYYIASLTLLIIGLNSWFVKYFEWGKSNEIFFTLNKIALLLYMSGGVIFWIFYWFPDHYR